MRLALYCDNKRHLICTPYNIANLHLMAEQLNIKRCWFHNKRGREHYDIPKKLIREVQNKCNVVSTKEILKIMSA